MLSLPPWLFGLCLLLSFAAGFGAGSWRVFSRWMLHLTTGSTSGSQPLAEAIRSEHSTDALGPMEDRADVLERGAQELMEMAAQAGRPVSYDRAMEMAKEHLDRM